MAGTRGKGATKDIHDTRSSLHIRIRHVKAHFILTIRDIRLLVLKLLMQNTLTILLLLFIDAKTERKLGRHLRKNTKPDPACSQHEASAQHQQLLRGTLNSVRGKENPKIDEVPAWPSPEWCRNTEIESEDGLAAGWPGPGPGWRGGAPAALLSRSPAYFLPPTTARVLPFLHRYFMHLADMPRCHVACGFKDLRQFFFEVSMGMAIPSV